MNRGLTGAAVTSVLFLSLVQGLIAQGETQSFRLAEALVALESIATTKADESKDVIFEIDDVIFRLDEREASTVFAPRRAISDVEAWSPNPRLGTALRKGVVDSAADEPWTLNSVFQDWGAPDWLHVWGEQRFRYESLLRQFRSGSRLSDPDDFLVSRTLLALEARFDAVDLLLELQDSRQFGATQGSFLTTGDINAVELLSASATIRLGDLWHGEHQVELGRLTFDLGSRRLIARNRFRNTINAFTGIKWDWSNESSDLSVFYVLPVRRRPSDFESLRDNEVDVDRESFGSQFFGVFWEQALSDSSKFELYGLGLIESGQHSPGRCFATIGGRTLGSPSADSFDHELELIFQVGESRPSALSLRRSHLAGFAHLHLGYTFGAGWHPRLELSFDFASGDVDPLDGEANRFDSLFGAPTEYGPTGAYGLLMRHNLLTAALRVEVRPEPNVKLSMNWRPAWLASRRDPGTSAGIQDESGQSGRYLGSQFEFATKWDVDGLPLRLECGGVYFIRGGFLREAPNAPARDIAYYYLQMTWFF